MSARRIWALAAGVAVSMALAGCSVSGPPTLSPSAGVSGDRSSATTTRTTTPPTSQPPAAVYDPAGGAHGNLDYFDAQMSVLLAADARPGGRAIIDHLVSSGFDRGAMEVTADTTAVGLDVDATQFSVRFDDGCIVGQVGILGYSSLVAPVLGTGRCLVGVTRPIDW